MEVNTPAISSSKRSRAAAEGQGNKASSQKYKTSSQDKPAYTETPIAKEGENLYKREDITNKCDISNTTANSEKNNQEEYSFIAKDGEQVCRKEDITGMQKKTLVNYKLITNDGKHSYKKENITNECHITEDGEICYKKEDTTGALKTSWQNSSVTYKDAKHDYTYEDITNETEDKRDKSRKYEEKAKVLRHTKKPLAQEGEEEARKEDTQNEVREQKGGNNRGGPKKKIRPGQMSRLRRRAHKRDQKPEEAQPSEERGPNNEENTERENYSFIAKDGEQLNKKEDITNEIDISEDKDYKRH